MSCAIWRRRELSSRFGCQIVQVITQQLGIVVGHFLEVRHQPTLVDRVAVEAAGKLVVDAAAGHFFERGFGDGQQVLLVCLLVALEDQIDGRGVREFRRAPEAAVLDVELLRNRFDLGIDHAKIKLSARAGEHFGLRNGIRE